MATPDPAERLESGAADSLADGTAQRLKSIICKHSAGWRFCTGDAAEKCCSQESARGLLKDSNVPHVVGEGGVVLQAVVMVLQHPRPARCVAAPVRKGLPDM